METYNLKLEEFRRLEQELNQASRTLLDQGLEEPSCVETINVDEQLQAMHTTITSAGTVAQIVDLSEEDDVMEIPGSQEDGLGAKDSKTQAKAPFRGAMSPQKVAHLHLKVKKDKDKDKMDK